MDCAARKVDSSVACPIRGTWSRRGLLAMLTMAALMSNYVHVPILFGVDFIFGSVVSLVAAAWMGWRSAFVIGVAGSLVTLKLWHHPYFVLLSAFEAAFVSVTFRRFWDNVLVASTIFWLIPGAVIFGISYGLMLHMNPSGMLMLYLKQVINATFNAMIASGLLLAITLLRRPETRIPLQQACFNTLVALVFIPALAIVVAVSNSRIRTSQSSLLNATSSQAENIAHFLEIWRSENINLLTTLVKVSKDYNLRASPGLQREISVIHAANQRFADLYLANAEATTIAFTPQVDGDGKSLIGINFSDRPYYKEVRAVRAPVVSDVFMGRGGINFPIVCFVLPILETANNPKSAFHGYALASVDSRKLNQTLRTILADDSFSFTVIDRQGQIVTSSVDGILPLDPESAHFGSTVDPIANDSYRKMPIVSTGSAYTQWQATVLGSIKKVSSLGWTIRVEAPLGKFMMDAESFYIESFAQLLAITLAGMILSFLAVVWVSSPIQLLAKSTRDISQHPLSIHTLKWPRTPFAEISELIDNFQSMGNSLEQRFHELDREVKERKTTEQRLQIAMDNAQAANVAKSSFLANMSHEIRTPLSAIIGYAELLWRNQPNGEENSSCIDAILRNGRQLSQLVDDILDLSKIEAGHLKLVPEWVDMKDIVAGGIAVLTQRASSKGLELRITGSGKFPSRIFVDPLRVRQVLLNVVGNAIKFTNKGYVETNLYIAPSDDGTDIHEFLVYVTDTGPGIQPSEMESIFEPFVQADSSYSRRHGGTGLGLALSRTITQALGGDITIAKSAEGVGSTFALRLKIKADSQKSWKETLEEACAIVQTAPPSSGEGLLLNATKILLVDDSPDNRTLVSRMLSRYGATVRCAACGEEGVELARSETFDIVLMDMQMPGLDGYESTRTLRSQGYRVPIVALTAHAMNEEQGLSLQAGCDAHVTKPIKWEKLISVINRLVSGT